MNEAMLDLSDLVSPLTPGPGPEGLVSPLMGVAAFAVVVWRLAVRALRRGQEEESEE